MGRGESGEWVEESRENGLRRVGSREEVGSNAERRVGSNAKRAESRDG